MHRLRSAKLANLPAEVACIAVCFSQGYFVCACDSEIPIKTDANYYVGGKENFPKTLPRLDTDGHSEIN